MGTRPCCGASGVPQAPPRVGDVEDGGKERRGRGIDDSVKTTYVID